MGQHNYGELERPSGRIRQKNMQAIIAAAEVEFARHGYKGTSMQTIAEVAKLPKANLHYYFSNKQGLYIAVLSNILQMWDQSFNHLSVDDDPATALAQYIKTKMELSRRRPMASRVFAMEVISGGENLSRHFNQHYLQWFKQRAAVLQSWIDAGKMDPVDPVHLIFLLWSSTQHYADFAGQICRLTQKRRLSREDFEHATQHLTHIILKGCGLNYLTVEAH